MGEGGQDILSRRLPGLREETGAHFCVVNGENASGVGITPAQAQRVLEARRGGCAGSAAGAVPRKNELINSERLRKYRPVRHVGQGFYPCLSPVRVEIYLLNVSLFSEVTLLRRFVSFGPSNRLYFLLSYAANMGQNVLPPFTHYVAYR